MIGVYDYTVILTYLSALSAGIGIIVSLNGTGHPYYGTFFLLACLFITPAVLISNALLPNTEKRRLRYHKFLQGLSRFIINHVPGTKFSWANPYGEDFSKPAIFISNHQSHLDVMAVMMLTPKVVILTNDWVWNNFFYGALIHRAEFYPASDGMEANMPRLKDLVPWEKFRSDLEVIYDHERKSNSGRRPFDVVMMFKGRASAIPRGGEPVLRHPLLRALQEGYVPGKEIKRETAVRILRLLPQQQGCGKRMSRPPGYCELHRHDRPKGDPIPPPHTYDACTDMRKGTGSR